jgi:thiosulfate reductase/polysulfide reductase chain A
VENRRQSARSALPGRLCPRGTGGIGAHSDPDRLRAPLLRTHERGEEKWKEVTWEEALDYIAEKMKRIAASHGPEAMALFSHGIGGTFLKHTLKAYGTPNIAAPSFAQCRGPRDVGFRLTFGEDVGSPERTDIAHAECLVLIGSHLGENMHNTQVQEFATAVGRGARLIVVDPRLSVAASKAQTLPADQTRHRPRPDSGLDARDRHRKLYDADYVARHGFGFEPSPPTSPSTPRSGRTSETGIDPETIRATAREMARASGHPGPPRPPRELVRRRRPAQPGHRPAQRAARQLGPQGRFLPALARWTCRRIRIRLPQSEAPQGRQP